MTRSTRTEADVTEHLRLLAARLDRASTQLEQELGEHTDRLRAGGRPDPRERVLQGGNASQMSVVRRVLRKLRFGARPPDGTQNALDAVRRAIADLERQLKKQIRQAQQEQANAEEWERRAKLCAKAGDDELAEDALANRNWHLELKADRDRDVLVLDRAIATYRAFETEVSQLVSAKR